MLKKIILMEMILTAFLSYGQNVSHVFNTAGFNFKTSNVMADVSIGEAIMTMVANPSECATQGFLQPEPPAPIVSITGILKEDISCYPNPFHDYIYIVTKRQDLCFSLIDLTGRVVIEKSTEKSLNVASLNSGLYLLMATDAIGNVIYINKIYKAGF